MQENNYFPKNSGKKWGNVVNYISKVVRLCLSVNITIKWMLKEDLVYQ